MGFTNFARFEVSIDELLTCLHLFRIHWIGFGYLQNEGFLEVDGMVKGLSRGESPIFGLIENFGILGILQREFLFHLFHCLGKGGGKGELSMSKVPQRLINRTISVPLNQSMSTP